MKLVFVSYGTSCCASLLSKAPRFPRWELLTEVCQRFPESIVSGVSEFLGCLNSNAFHHAAEHRTDMGLGQSQVVGLFGARLQVANFGDADSTEKG